MIARYLAALTLLAAAVWYFRIDIHDGPVPVVVDRFTGRVIYVSAIPLQTHPAQP